MLYPKCWHDLRFSIPKWECTMKLALTSAPVMFCAANSKFSLHCPLAPHNGASTEASPGCEFAVPSYWQQPCHSGCGGSGNAYRLYSLSPPSQQWWQMYLSVMVDTAAVVAVLAVVIIITR